MKAKWAIWKGKWVAIKRILGGNYFIVFTYTHHSKVWVTAQWKREHKQNPLVNDIVESIYKEELRHDG